MSSQASSQIKTIKLNNMPDGFKAGTSMTKEEDHESEAFFGDDFDATGGSEVGGEVHISPPGLDNFIGGKRHSTPKAPASSSGSSSSSSSRSTSPLTSSSSSEMSDNESVATVDLLSSDPLFIVLSQFFMDKETGDNIATILEKINKNLEALVVATKRSQ